MSVSLVNKVVYDPQTFGRGFARLRVAAPLEAGTFFAFATCFATCALSRASSFGFGPVVRAVPSALRARRVIRAALRYQCALPHRQYERPLRRFGRLSESVHQPFGLVPASPTYTSRLQRPLKNCYYEVDVTIILDLLMRLHCHDRGAKLPPGLAPPRKVKLPVALQNCKQFPHSKSIGNSGHDDG